MTENIQVKEGEVELQEAIGGGQTAETILTEEEIWYQASEMRLNEMAGHWWWLVTVLILVFWAPTIVWMLAQLNKQPGMANNFPYTTLYLPAVTCLSIAIWFFIYSTIKLRKRTNFETYNIEENKIKGHYINDAVWEKFKAGGKNEKGEQINKRLKILISLLRLELFGWITYSTALAVALSVHVKNLATGNVWAVLDESTFDITRATVLGVITLFFTQMLKNYQNSIGKADSAAKIAKEAATMANNAIIEIGIVNKTAIEKISESNQEIIKGVKTAVDGIMASHKTLEGRTDQLKDVLLSSADALESEYILKGLRELIQSVAGNANIRQLTEPLAIQINQIGDELKKSKDDKIEFTALAVLQSTYFKTEALSFENIKRQDQSLSDTTNQIIKSGCRLSTNYTHYAKTVQALVDTLEEISNDSEETDKYEYYTILNAKPDEFFNIENDKVNLLWQISFLEGHCRKHAEKNIKFQRYFTRRKDEEEIKKGKRYPPKYDYALDKEVILCGKEDGNPKLFINPEKLRQELELTYQTDKRSLEDREKNTIFNKICLSDSQYQAILSINSNQTSYDIDKNEPSYIIKIDELNDPDCSAAQFRKQLIEQNISDLEFKPLKELLLEKYHSRIVSPKFITFDSFDSYDEFFGENIPRDLVAVRSNGEWKLCLGVMIGSDIPTAVTLVFLTKDRDFSELSWETLTNKLDILFQKNDISNRNIHHANF